ncbi:MAG: glycosyltransferase [Acidobacteriia bacterium]|nr:glycosyltransferase [Terriglobia bacterium]
MNLLIVMAPLSPWDKAWRSVFPHDRFVGLYQANGFDLMLLIPYFTVLTILAMYGFHRYHLVYLYFKHRANRAKITSRFDSLPRVTIQLPIFNELYVVDRLVEAVSHFQYPRELLQVQVLDDSTDETQEIARQVVERYHGTSLDISYHHRSNRTGFKAGALEEGLKTATGEFIAIFDADFTPPADFLERTIHYFTEPKVGMVQTRWGHINRNYSFLTQVESILLDGHFVIEHGARFLARRFFNFNGTAGIWRRKAIETAGGWEHDTLTEDTDLSYRAQMQGWKFVYVPEIVCDAELPVEMNAFKVQQFRWAKGLIQCAKKDLPMILRAQLPLRVKIEAFFHLTANIAYPLMVILSLILLPATIVRFYQGWSQMLWIDLPLFMASTFSISSFYLVSQRELFPDTWWRKIKYLPFLMSVGIGLSISNTRAVIEALLGIQTSFKRTPKYRIENQKDTWTVKKYRRKSGFTPYIELLLGTYFAVTVYYLIINEDYAVTPFLLLFVIGYLYTGFMSLMQTYMANLRAIRQAFLGNLTGWFSKNTAKVG